MMKHHAASLLVLAMSLGPIGCTGDVETTDDSVRVETEVPKVEIGEGEVDLDPRTDHDVDIDTPAPGDK
jgi:hypothetical protein